MRFTSKVVIARSAPRSMRSLGITVNLGFAGIARGSGSDLVDGLSTLQSLSECKSSDGSSFKKVIWLHRNQ